MAQNGLVARVRGGVRALNRGQSEVGFDLRLRLEVGRKSAIARAAAALVDEGEAVALDASTTAYYLALELRSKRELVVVTNGLLVATALADAPGITVLVTGGTLRLSAMSLVGDLGTDVLRTTRINKGFLGARGLSLERGLMDLNPDEVRIKQEMADACEQVYGILDGTKWHRSALLSFVAPDDLTGIVTDSSAPDEEVATWRSRDVEVIVGVEQAEVDRPRVDGDRVDHGVTSGGAKAVVHPALQTGEVPVEVVALHDGRVGETLNLAHRQRLAVEDAHGDATTLGAEVDCSHRRH